MLGEMVVFDQCRDFHQEYGWDGMKTNETGPCRLQTSEQMSAVQRRNGTTGAAMSLLKNCEVRNSPPVSRNVSRNPSRPVEVPTTNFSEINSDGSSAGRLIFVEDFTEEHSLPGLDISSVENSSYF
jgi:hypothetical protein